MIVMMARDPHPLIVIPRLLDSAADQFLIRLETVVSDQSLE